MISPQEFLEQHGSLAPPEQLDSLVAVLRGPEGCPWDQKQTALTMVDYLIDEAHELKEALLNEPAKANEELGDLLFTLRFVQQAMGDQGSTCRAVASVVEKMVRRHPHVFAKETFDSDSDIRKNWEAEKRREQPKLERLDDDIAASTPPLKRAQKVLGRAMGAGFRYPSTAAAWDKVEEEFSELEAALTEDDPEHLEEEFGDLLLSLVTLAKHKRIKPENALRRAEAKLCDRIARLEQKAGRPLVDIPTAELPGLWRDVRKQQTPGAAYFNSCGVALWPRPVRVAVREAAQRIGREGLAPVLELRERREAELRAVIGRLTQARADQVVLSPNISSSALAVAYAQDWQPGDSLLLGRSEFPANTVPWALAANTFGVRLLDFEEDQLRTDPEAAWSRLEQKLETHRPRLLALSAVSFWSGFRVDLKRLGELCSRFGTRLFVDGIQAFGTSPLGMGPGIDYLAGGSHKGLMSPECAGFLVVSDRAAQDWTPRFGSWLSLPNPVDFLVSGLKDGMPESLEVPAGRPTVLEGGSVNTIGYAGLQAAIEWLLERGVENIFEHVQTLLDDLEAGLKARGWTSLRAVDRGGRSAILSMEPPFDQDLLEIHAYLASHSVITGIPNGRLRFGCHWFNSPQDIQRTLAVLDDR